MNLYLRYFDDEVVVTNVDAALDFIRSIQGFNVTPQFEADFREYAGGTIPFPKRYKVRQRVYFIVIKTTAATLEEFKANGKNVGLDGMVEDELGGNAPRLRQKDLARIRLNDECPGWYEGTIYFKRVISNPNTGKSDYVDTTFSALVKAYSAQDCYNRLIDHLQSRDDVDPRSQYPSARGKNFRYEYLGIKPLSELNVEPVSER